MSPQSIPDESVTHVRSRLPSINTIHAHIKVHNLAVDTSMRNGPLTSQNPLPHQITQRIKLIHTLHNNNELINTEWLQGFTSLYGENTTIGRLGFTKSSRRKTTGVGYIFVATINLSNQLKKSESR